MDLNAIYDDFRVGIDDVEILNPLPKNKRRKKKRERCSTVWRVWFTRRFLFPGLGFYRGDQIFRKIGCFFGLQVPLRF